MPDEQVPLIGYVQFRFAAAPMRLAGRAVTVLVINEPVIGVTRGTPVEAAVATNSIVVIPGVAITRFVDAWSVFASHPSHSIPPKAVKMG